MLTKLKEISEIHEYLASIKAGLAQILDESAKQQQSLGILGEQMDHLKGELDAQREKVSSFSVVVDELRTIKDTLSKEAHEFRVLKTQTQRKIMDRFEEDLTTELRRHTDTLRQDMQAYASVRKDVSIIATDIRTTIAELEKFTAISKQIKEADFNLNKYAKRLSESDQEKLKLMQRIDGLERLVSKIRRAKS
ncbi:hypothetical protein H6504_00055 [Candidatus Woesearchaeota archaeon]|nr:hypothetical protein [Candidatus Woesearchaeota archaeon]